MACLSHFIKPQNPQKPSKNRFRIEISTILVRQKYKAATAVVVAALLISVPGFPSTPPAWLRLISAGGN